MKVTLKIVTAFVGVFAYVAVCALVVWILVGGVGFVLYALGHQVPR